MSIKKTYAIFGLGRYGLSVAKELEKSGLGEDAKKNRMDADCCSVCTERIGTDYRNPERI